MSLLEDLKKIDEIEEVIVTAPKKEKPIIQQAVQNLPGSTYQLGADIVNTIINPVTSAKSILSLGKGIIQLVSQSRSGGSCAKVCFIFSKPPYLLAKY